MTYLAATRVGRLCSLFNGSQGHKVVDALLASSISAQGGLVSDGVMAPWVVIDAVNAIVVGLDGHRVE